VNRGKYLPEDVQKMLRADTNDAVTFLQERIRIPSEDDPQVWWTCHKLSNWMPRACSHHRLPEQDVKLMSNARLGHFEPPPPPIVESVRKLISIRNAGGEAAMRAKMYRSVSWTL
jgi:hypothetical protein